MIFVTHVLDHQHHNILVICMFDLLLKTNVWSYHFYVQSVWLSYISAFTLCQIQRSLSEYKHTNENHQWWTRPRSMSLNCPDHLWALFEASYIIPVNICWTMIQCLPTFTLSIHYITKSTGLMWFIRLCSASVPERYPRCEEETGLWGRFWCHLLFSGCGPTLSACASHSGWWVNYLTGMLYFHTCISKVTEVRISCAVCLCK